MPLDGTERYLPDLRKPSSNFNFPFRVRRVEDFKIYFTYYFFKLQKFLKMQYLKFYSLNNYFSTLN